MKKLTLFSALSFTGFMLQLLLASCSGSGYTKEIAALDSTKLRLDSAEAELNKLDTALLGQMYRQIENDLHFVEVFYRNMPKDSIIDKDAATILSDYRSVRKPLRSSYTKLPKLKQDIDYSQSQIENLIHDLGSNNIEKSDAQQYVKTEMTEAEKAIQNSKFMLILLQDVFPRYDAVSPRVRAYVDSLKAVEAKQ